MEARMESKMRDIPTGRYVHTAARYDKPTQQEFTKACNVMAEIILLGRFSLEQKAALQQVQLWLRQEYMK